MSETTALLIGEAWQSLQFDLKGFDFFSRSTYHEAIGPLRNGLETNGVETEYIPTTRAASEAPVSAEEIAEFDVVVLSDIGFNTLALPPRTFDEFEQVPNRLRLLEDFVQAGGGLIMVGGYLSFQGINGKANYKDTPVEKALPVTMQSYDDRVERSDGVRPTVTETSHAIVDRLPDEWPAMLGYNRVVPDGNAEQLARVDDDPLLVIGEHGEGRTAAFTSDCAPHWSAPEFTNWKHYDALWTNIVNWTAGE